MEGDLREFSWTWRRRFREDGEGEDRKLRENEMK